MNEKYFIHFYKSPRNCYFYDVNKDSIVNISDEVYEYLNRNISDEQLSDNGKNFLIELKEKGYLSNKRFSEIKHPLTDELVYLLDNKCGQLILQVTQFCNLACAYCAYACKDNESLQRPHSNVKMSWETAKESIDFFNEHSKCCESLSFSFYGGEPLAAFELIKKSVEYIQEQFLGKKIRFNMTTNATLFNDEMIEFLIKNEFNLCFSIDGPKEIHDANRKRLDGTGSFDAAFSNLKKIAKAYGDKALEKISINMVINPINDINKNISLFEDEFFKEFPINVRSQRADDSYLGKELSVAEDYEAKSKYLNFMSMLDMFGLVDNLDIPLFLKNNALYAISNYVNFKNSSKSSLPDSGAPGGPCVPGQRRLFVDAKGDFYPCERVSEVSDCMIIGNIKTGFDYEKADAMLNIARTTEDACKNCYAARYCSLCARAADVDGKFSGKKRLQACKKSRSKFDTKMMTNILIKESRTVYKWRG